MIRQSNHQWGKAALLSLASTLAFAAKPGAFVQSAYAQAQTKAVSLDAGPLAKSIVDLGDLFGINIIVEEALVLGKSAPAVGGNLSAREALDRLLTDSDLSAAPSSAAGFVITQNVVRAGSVAIPASAPQNENDPEPEPDPEPLIAETIVVTGTDQTRYIVGSSDALGLNLDFLDNPRNITVVPEQLLLDRKITTLEEALRNVPGAVAAAGFGGTQDDFRLRGFGANDDYRNGFRRASVFKANLANVDYVQVIRGPAAIIYGQVEPGGVVDVVTK